MRSLAQVLVQTQILIYLLHGLYRFFRSRSTLACDNLYEKTQFLVQQAKEGDSEAINALYLLYEKRLKGAAKNRPLSCIFHVILVKSQAKNESGPR